MTCDKGGVGGMGKCDILWQRGGGGKFFLKKCDIIYEQPQNMKMRGKKDNDLKIWYNWELKVQIK